MELGSGSTNIGDLSSNIGGNNLSEINLGVNNLDYRGGIISGELILEDQGSNDNRKDLILGELKDNGGGVKNLSFECSRAQFSIACPEN